MFNKNTQEENSNMDEDKETAMDLLLSQAEGRTF
jgi:hypothetical protein